jgi:hypothetical protein
MNYIAVLTLSLLSCLAVGDLKPMEFDDMDQFLSKIPKIENKKVDHSYNIQANFSIGNSRVNQSNCTSKSNRKDNSFYGCWLNQAQPLLDKLSFLLTDDSIRSLKTNISFELSSLGHPKNIKISGFNDTPTKNQLTNLLKVMEFGSSNRSNNQLVNVSINSKISG